jgi:hypothetical protein
MTQIGKQPTVRACSLVTMTRCLTLLLPILLALPVLAADPPKDLLGTFKATPFQKVDRLDGLPGSVRQAVHDLLKSNIANPGEKWNATYDH